MLTSVIAGSYAKCVFIFVRNGQMLFQVAVPFCIPTINNEISTSSTFLPTLGIIGLYF